MAALALALCALCALSGGCRGGAGKTVDGATTAEDGGRDGASDGPPLDGRIVVFAGTIRGRVVSSGSGSNSSGVADAVVRFGGRIEHVRSGADGRFTLAVSGEPVRLDQIALTAGKSGYFSAGLEVFDPAAEQVIELARVELADNPAYVYKSPDELDAAPFCIHCHKNQLSSWQASAHAAAAKNPVVHDLYNGTASGFATEADCVAAGGAWRTGQALGGSTAAKKCYVGGGLLADLNPAHCGGVNQPTCDDPGAASLPQLGPCADCHAPATPGHQPGATNLNSVAELAFDKGIHCDFCHKIERAEANEKPGMNGAITMLRPGAAGAGGWSDPEVMFGPLSDVIISIMGNVLQPQFAQAELCSACHQWSSQGLRPAAQGLVDKSKWPAGLPIYDTYFEWSASSSAAGTPCQRCHMPAIRAATAAEDLDPLIPWTNGVMGWPRPYGQVHDHGFAARPPPAPAGHVAAPGEPPREALRRPIAMAVTAQRVGPKIEVSVTLTNNGAGHSIPTGAPHRQLVLVVRAAAGGAPLPASGGYTIPAWGGAWHTGSIGAGGATLSGNQLTLPGGQSWPAAAVGRVVRFVLPSGSYDDYPGTRWFADPARTATEKGIEISTPLASAHIVAAAGAVATLSSTPAVSSGARFHVGAPLPGEAVLIDQELPATPLAGAPGHVFAKLLVDEYGELGVPLFRAVDIAADNRIPADKSTTTQHVFDASTTASLPVTISALLLHRNHAWPLAQQRGWPAVDVVRASETVTVP